MEETKFRWCHLIDVDADVSTLLLNKVINVKTHRENKRITINCYNIAQDRIHSLFSRLLPNGIQSDAKNPPLWPPVPAVLATTSLR